MSSKRPRTKASSSSAPAFDPNRFVSEEASALCSKYVKHKKIIPERGLAPCPANQSQLYDNITNRGWTDFVKQPEAAVASIVREFYANIVDGEPTSYVRGRRVPFDGTTINQYYNLPNIEGDGYHEYFHERLDLDAILLELCKPGSTWITGGGEVIRTKGKSLTFFNRIWHSFICARLLPVGRLSDVTKERAILLYAIVTELSIDVGQLINSSIRRLRRGSTTGGLGHPSLITALCKTAGVRWDDNEELIHPTGVMDVTWLLRERRKERLELENRDDDEPEEEADDEHATPSMEDHFEQLNLCIDRHHQRSEAQFARLNSRMERHHQRSEAQFAHLYELLQYQNNPGEGHMFPSALPPYESPPQED